MLTTRNSKHILFKYLTLLLLFMAVVFSNQVLAQKMPPNLENTKSEPIKYIGEEQTDPKYTHGSLRHVVGVHRYQALRANRDNPPVIGSRTGWTYNHQPYLCYWNGQFFFQFLSNQYTEHHPPGRTSLMTSNNGRDWSNPEIIFPEYSLPEINYKDEDGEVYYMPEGSKSIMHQRMGFYISSDDRLLTLGFYSFSPITRIGPNNGQGLGRVVREIYKDGSFGPVYFIRYNRHAGWNENNTDFPFYKESKDEGFVDACVELLNDKLITLQWEEEDQSKDGFYRIETGKHTPKAFNYFYRPDGVVVGIWKHQLTALSPDSGKTWTEIAQSQTLKTCGAKTWGQQTLDGKYALVYNHSSTRRNRFPMVVMTSDDGHTFDNMLCLNGEVPPMRYYGWAKNLGPQYIRGIMQGNGNPPGNYMWNVYSMNKEDMWITRTHLPITGNVDEHVNQNFDDLTSAADLELWNLYVPKWAPVDIIEIPGESNKVLQLTDEEPYDYAGADRHFPPSSKATIEFSLFIKDFGKDFFEFELHNKDDERALRLHFDPRIEGLNFDLGNVEPDPAPFAQNKWYDIKLSFDCEKGNYTVWLNGEKIHEEIEFDIKTETLERMVFRTGSWRSDVRLSLLEGEPGGPGLHQEDLAGADDKVAKSTFWIDNVKTYYE